MFKTTSTFSVLSVLSGLLLAAACARPVVPRERDGGVELVLSSASDAQGSTPSQLTLTGLDRAFQTRVELASSDGSRSVTIELPAGLYAVDAAASSSSDEPVIPALSAPKLVVVAPGRVTTVNVYSVERPVVAALDATLAR